jgi:hypothetical protein
MKVEGAKSVCKDHSSGRTDLPTPTGNRRDVCMLNQPIRIGD